MELSIAGQVLRCARQSNLSGGVSLRKADGWNMKNHSHLTDSRQALAREDSSHCVGCEKTRKK